MGRGTSGAGRYRGGNLNPADIVSTELMTWSGTRTQVEQDFFNTCQELHGEYGNDVLPQDFLQTAKLKGSGERVIAYYDGRNVAVNEKYNDPAVLTAAYDDCINNGFHSPRGNRSAAEAVAAHELAHRLTDAAAERMGGTDLRSAANRIVEEARKATGHRGTVALASRISKYATANTAETIAEAFADVFCNGNNAKRESRAVVDILNRYVKGR